ncbi:hypothetical protein CR513_04062, partial [Mucuna pruriens]
MGAVTVKSEVLGLESSPPSVEKPQGVCSDTEEHHHLVHLNTPDGSTIPNKPIIHHDGFRRALTSSEASGTANGTLPEMQVQLAQISMEGITLELRCLNDCLWIRYGDHQLGNPFSQLKLLQQTGTIDEYVEAFEVLMA